MLEFLERLKFEICVEFERLWLISHNFNAKIVAPQAKHFFRNADFFLNFRLYGHFFPTFGKNTNNKVYFLLNFNTEGFARYYEVTPPPPHDPPLPMYDFAANCNSITGNSS